jgi:hypothetical protein
MASRRRRIGLGLLALTIASLVWLPALHLLYARAPERFVATEGVPPEAQALLKRHLALWTDPKLRAREIAKMRGSNAEWDFMGRSYLVWSLANLALRDPGQQTEALRVMDQIIDETLTIESERGPHFFLMAYSRDRAFVDSEQRSQFLDGELALMLGLRCLVADRPEYRVQLRERVAVMERRMRKSPVLSAESYPNECWTFCNAVALAAIAVADRLDGTDHRALFRDWVATARKKLVHPETGLLVSSYTWRGDHLDGPEGSSIWMVVHCLALIDEPFARDQYERARRELGRELFGFGYAAEWPRSWKGPADIDSGPVIPLLDASPGSSGLAFVGAGTFGDRTYLARLHATLELAGFPIEERGSLRYAASNQVGDAVMLYAMLLGPAWEKVKAGR